MKHITSKQAYLRLAAITMLLMGTVSANAQYYMNVFKKNGTKVEFLISDLDSVTFSSYVSPVIPVNKKYLSKLSRTYVENYDADGVIESFTFTFRYDNQNRVSAILSNDGTVKLDYSQSGSILVKSEENDTLSLFQLDNNGYTNTIKYPGSSSKVVVEYDGEYISRFASGPVSGEPEPGHIYFSYDYVHANGVLTHMIINEYDFELPYRYNYLNPAINVDVDWLIFTGGGVETAPMWLGYCGKISDRLFEFPIGFLKTNRSSMHGSNTDKEPGTYHYEHKYYSLANDYLTGGGNVTITNDSDGCPLSITYSLNVEEYIHSYDYVVEVDTIAIKDGEAITHRIEHMVSGTERDEPTGNVVGTNDVVYSFEYKQ